MNFKLGIWLPLFLLLTATPLAAQTPANPKELKISRVTPSGDDVPSGQQIVIQFNRPVVPVGRMERKSQEIPIEITPALNCEWRWLNTSALACQLKAKEALKKATIYQMTVRPGIKAQDGATIAQPYKHQFITARPAVRYAWIENWREPGLPVFRVSFNQLVTRDSVADHFAVEYAGKHIGVTVEAPPDPERKEEPKANHVWLLLPEHALPLDMAGVLTQGPGIVSTEGPEKSIQENNKLETFQTFPEFKWLGLECTTNAGKVLTIAPTDSPEDHERCNPLRAFRLLFSSPVKRDYIKQEIQLTPNPWSADKKKEGEEEALGPKRHISSPHKKDKIYKATLTYHLKAWQNYELNNKPATYTWLDRIKSFFVDLPETNIRDAFGRPLFLPIHLEFATNHRLPDYKLVHESAVLEQQVDTHVPLYVTNLDKVELQYNQLGPDSAKKNQTSVIKVPEVEDISFAIPLKVRELTGGKSGAVYGTLSSTPHVEKYAGERTLFAQVTPYAVHAKIGHYNSLVWVTDLATGKPVSDIRIQLRHGTLKSLNLDSSALAEGISNAKGLVILPGTETLDPKLDWVDRWGNDDKIGLFLLLEKSDDMALLPLDGRFTIDTYSVSPDVYAYKRQRYGHIRSWGSTAQGIYRAGDTIQYKIYVRNEDNKTLVAAPPASYQLIVTDPTGKEVYKRENIALSSFGAFNGEFKVPKKGAVGWYEFQLKSDFFENSWYPLRVLVTDFTPAPFKVETSLNGDLFEEGDEVDVTSIAKLHSGGPYTQAQARVNAVIREQSFRPSHPISKNFEFDTYRDQAQASVFQGEKALDDRGTAKNEFKIPSQKILYGKLLVETTVQDDRGKSVAGRASAAYIGVNRLVGLRSTQWVYTANKPARFEYVVVNATGAPVADTAVKLTLERRVLKASRIKGSGNAYLKGYTEEWQAVGNCETKKALAEANSCEITPKQAGSYRLRAEIRDKDKREQQSEIYTWVAGSDYVLWDEDNDFGLSIVPEQESYRIGDTARYLIKNPFPGAQALITIERYGVIKHWTQTLNESTSLIEFPVEPDFMPGFYLSVVVTSPRVEKPLGKDNVDLGKPAFRMGYVRVPVRDPYKEIGVAIKTEQPVYKPRDRVKVSLRAKPRHVSTPEPIEVAVAVLDEAVFDLIQGGKSHFDPYEGFYHLGDLDLTNFNLLTRLIGIQKFEKKGASPGGGGGGDLAMRTLFKFVSYWNPSLQTDSEGHASFDFELPDNLTGWRILAMAVTPSDRMGLGQGNFKVNRPTQILSALPNQVSLGDRFDAGFTIMNRTDKKRTIQVQIKASGPIDTATTPASFEKTVELEPYKRTQVWMPVQTRGQASRDSTLALQFKVIAGDQIDRDGLEQTLPVLRRASIETAADYGTTTSNQAKTSIQFPKGMRTDLGQLNVNLTPSVIGDVGGAFRYMADYIYTCWEQRLSKGVMASHFRQLRKYLPKAVKWPNHRKVVRQMLEDAVDFQTPSGAMSYYKPEDAYASPYLSAYTALAFNWLHKAGHKIPDNVEKKLHKYLDTLLKRNVAPSYYTKGMASTVRAVALNALAAHGKVARSDLERYRSHVPAMSLFGKAQYMQAVIQIPNTHDLAQDVMAQILAHSSQSGGKFSFNEELDDGYNRILATPMRTHCAILSALVQGEQEAGLTTNPEDIPFKMVRTLTQARGRKDHWENTQENLFCMNALVNYSRLYEDETPDMDVTASLDNESIGTARFESFQDKPVTLTRNFKTTDPGRQATLNLKRDGLGRLYYSTLLSYALKEPRKERINSGIEIRREYSVRRDNKWVLLDPVKIKRGDVVRVDIFLSLPTSHYFVVVDDPVPGGLEPINRDLATASVLDAEAGDYVAAGGSYWFKFTDWSNYGISRWSFYHQELRHDAVRFYSEYLAPGNYHLSYTAQAIATGEFALLPVHAEEMYDPDVYGKGLPQELRVEQKK